MDNISQKAKDDVGDRKNLFEEVGNLWVLVSLIRGYELPPQGLLLPSMPDAIAKTYPNIYKDAREDCIVVAVGEDGADIIDRLIVAMNQAISLIVDNPRQIQQKVPEWLGRSMYSIMDGGKRIIDVLLDEEGGAALFTDSKKAQEILRRNIEKKNEFLYKLCSPQLKIDEERIQYHATIGVLLWREVMIDRAMKESSQPTKPHWQDIELLLTVWTRLLHVPNFTSNQWTDAESLKKHVASLEEDQRILLISCIKKVVAMLKTYTFQLNAPFAPEKKRFVDDIFGGMPQRDASTNTNDQGSLTDIDLSWLMFIRHVAENALSWTDEEISMIQNQLRTSYPAAVTEEPQSL